MEALSVPQPLVDALLFLATLFIVILGTAMLAVVVMAIADYTQRSNAIRHNYPVIGRMRYALQHLGRFLRSYFFAMDREELPFNRAQREWVERAAKNDINVVPFGSTKDLRPTGTVMFVNCPYPTLERDERASPRLVIGPHCREPYNARSLFNISGMSYGAISRPAVQAMSRGARLAKCWMNTGEGGLTPYHLEGGCELVFQIGTAKYGVRNRDGELSERKLSEVAAHSQVKMFEIKLSQGAKPGKGGILPGKKVTEDIARIRGIPAFQDSISPNRFPEIDNNSELLDFIGHIREVTGKPVGFKTVIGAYGWLDEFLTEIRERGSQNAPDFITVDSADGGTGAAPMSLIDHVGLPVRESLPLVVDKLNEHGLRDRIIVIASGKLINPAEVAWAFCAGADFVQSARGFMFSIGCIMALRCHTDRCPSGVATHNRRLQAGLDPNEKSVRVKHYVENMIKEVNIIAHSCGVPEPRRFRRHHCRIVCADGLTRGLHEVFPDRRPMPQAAQ